MKKRMLNVIFTMLIVGILLTGCKKNIGTPEDNAVQTPAATEEEGEDKEEVADGKTFGYSCINTGNPYFDILKQSIEIALDEKDYNLRSKDPGTDVELQIQQIQEMIEAGVDGVILCPVDWEKITPALEALKKANIPVINVDTRVKETKLVDAYIGADNKKAGFLCGEDLVRQRPQGGKISILECPSVNAVNERITGFEEALSKAEAGFEVLARSDAQGKKEAAKAGMKKILEENSQIDAVMCGDDQTALGALAAIQEAKRTDILVYGVDGAPAVKKELANKDSAMTGTAAQAPITIGRRAVETGLAILAEGEYVEEINVDVFFINKESVGMYGTDGWQ